MGISCCPGGKEPGPGWAQHGAGYELSTWVGCRIQTEGQLGNMILCHSPQNHLQAGQRHLQSHSRTSFSPSLCPGTFLAKQQPGYPCPPPLPLLPCAFPVGPRAGSMAAQAELPPAQPGRLLCGFPGTSSRAMGSRYACCNRCLVLFAKGPSCLCSYIRVELCLVLPPMAIPALPPLSSNMSLKTSQGVLGKSRGWAGR